MNRLVCQIGITIMLLGLLEAGATFSCDCIPFVSLQKAIGCCSQVFSGEVLRVEDDTHGGQIPYAMDYIVTFRVQKAWKGVNTDKVIIGTAKQGAACGFLFQQGQHYLVFASHGRTSTCTPTRLLENSRPLLELLGPPSYVPIQ